MLWTALELQLELGYYPLKNKRNVRTLLDATADDTGATAAAVPFPSTERRYDTRKYAPPIVVCQVQ